VVELVYTGRAYHAWRLWDETWPEPDALTDGQRGELEVIIKSSDHFADLVVLNRGELF
jgi:hypothetical protein